MKLSGKLCAALLAALMLLAAALPITSFAEGDSCVVAGTPAEIFGTLWDATNNDNRMIKGSDGKFTKTYTVSKAYEEVSLLCVFNGEWFGKNGYAVDFDLTGPGSFTVSFDPATEKVSVGGAIVSVITELEYETVYAVGNGEAAWLNGVVWDPSAAANKMTKVEKDVWRIEFNGVYDGFDRQIKFALDGSWTYNFGANRADFEPGVWTDAVYNGNNVTFDTEDECDIVVYLDLRRFDYESKSGAKLAVFIDEDPGYPEGDRCVVAGTPEEIFGTLWDATNNDNRMVKGSDGKYAKTYTVSKAYEEVSLLCVFNGEWFGKNGYAVDFDLTGPGSFTVSFDPATEKVSVGGAIVSVITELEYETVYAVGNGEAAWLNGVVWDPSAAANKMTKVEKDVWRIEFDGVYDGFERQIKFALDGSWTYNFGANRADFEPGVWVDAVYNGNNVTFDTEDGSDIVVYLDLRRFDFESKTGAKLAVFIDEDPGYPEGDLPEPGVYAVGNGSGNYLFGADWQAGDARNRMEALTDTYYDVAYYHVAPGDYELKFVIDGSLANGWFGYNGSSLGSGGFDYADWQGESIRFTVTRPSTIALSLDLCDYDADTHEGAFFAVFVRPDPVEGDVDNDGDCDIEDVTALLNMLASGSFGDTPVDLNGDGATDILDVSSLLNLLAGA